MAFHNGANPAGSTWSAWYNLLLFPSNPPVGAGFSNSEMNSLASAGSPVMPSRSPPLRPTLPSHVFLDGLGV